MKLYLFSILLCVSIYAHSQKIINTISVGTNVGGFDHSSGYGPVFFLEYDWTVSNYLKISPHLQMATATNSNDYISMGVPYTVYKQTNSLDPGILFKIVPLPNSFSRLKLTGGLSYLMESTLKSDPEIQTESRLLKQKGFNGIAGIDVEIVKTKWFGSGINMRINTSNKRILLYHFGIITSIYIPKQSK